MIMSYSQLLVLLLSGEFSLVLRFPKDCSLEQLVPSRPQRP